MTKKEAFIKMVQEIIFDNTDNYNDYFESEDGKLAQAYWADFQKASASNTKEMTDTGYKIICFMQENMEALPMLAKDIGDGIGTSGRSVAGSMRKLATDGYVEKIGKDPTTYDLTDKGKEYAQS